MKEFKVVRLLDLNPQDLEQAAEVFAASYREQLRPLSRDAGKIRRLIAGAMLPHAFYAAVWKGQVAGIAAVSDSRSRSLRFDPKILRSELGVVKGMAVYGALDSEFHKRLILPEDTCYIEAVATLPEFRGNGIASGLLQNLMDTLSYRVFTLEVADTNPGAMRVYERLGFEIYRTKKQRFMRKRLGFNARLYMKREKPNVHDE